MSPAFKGWDLERLPSQCEGFYVCFELVKDLLFAALESEFFFDNGVGTASSPFHALYFEFEHFA